jgi:hypothetical protein
MIGWLGDGAEHGLLILHELDYVEELLWWQVAALN